MLNIGAMLEAIKERKPLIHHITNWVTIYDCANITRAIGALPVMAHAKEEVQEMVAISSALVLNIGTLTSKLVDAMILAGKKANELNIPIVLDAVGVGATTLRTDKALEILNNIHVDVIKGNSSEIATIGGIEAKTRGVEAVDVSSDLKFIAKEVAEKNNSVVVITGKEDIISDNKRGYIVKNGHEMLSKLVGTGCMVASVIGCFIAVEKDYINAATGALACFGIAGELAAKRAKGPGSYKELFYDEIYNLNFRVIEEMNNIEEVKW